MTEESDQKKNPIVWDYEKENPEKAKLLKDALQQARDPELGYSVTQLGLVRNVKVTDGQALITMIMTTPFCPYAPALMDDVRMYAEQALGMPVHMDLQMDPWDPSMMEDGTNLDWGLF